ncbi:MAG: steroid 5-alpha reductase family enzyme [Bacteroidia bacterium]|jgi:steroid 5-alpha reductase family enzyme
MMALAIIGLVATAIAWAGSDGGVMLGSLPLMAVVVVMVFVIQWLAFIPAYKYQTERFYDLTGSLTYIAATLLALVGASVYDLRSALLATFIIIWAVRLGSFLFVRISQDGRDSRFDKIKPSPTLFFRTWSLQGLWVAVTAGAALAAITSAESVALSVMDSFGIALWVFGFGMEVIADRQKRLFRQVQGPEKFITSGLWSRSRHPNYFGEITLWLGIAVLAMPALQGWQIVTLVSPVFVYLLLTRVSGVAMLEHISDRRWGEDPEYVAYKANTPVLVPRLLR